MRTGFLRLLSTLCLSPLLMPSFLSAQEMLKPKLSCDSSLRQLIELVDESIFSRKDPPVGSGDPRKLASIVREALSMKQLCEQNVENLTRTNPFGAPFGADSCRALNDLSLYRGAGGGSCHYSPEELPDGFVSCRLDRGTGAHPFSQQTPALFTMLYSGCPQGDDTRDYRADWVCCAQGDALDGQLSALKDSASELSEAAYRPECTGKYSSATWDLYFELLRKIAVLIAEIVDAPAAGQDGKCPGLRKSRPENPDQMEEPGQMHFD